MAFLLKYEENLYKSNKYFVLILYFRWGTKFAIVGGATFLVANHEIFGTNKYTQQTINKIRTSLPDTAEAFDQMPTKQELNDSLVDSWNSGINFFLNLFFLNPSLNYFLGVQTTFKWLVDAPKHTRQLSSSLVNKIKG
jgi:hypothetical protein